MPVCNIVRGPCGSGKSTFAKTLNCYHLEADMFFMIDGKYQWSADRIKQAHAWCKGQFNDALLRAIDVVVSNTFTCHWEFLPYIELAQSFNYEVKVYKCIGDFENAHDVPLETIQRMKDRWEDYDGEIIVEPKVRFV